MNYRVVLSEPAQDEAEEVYFWICKDSLVRAEKWLNGLLEAVNSLGFQPDQYPFAPEAETFQKPIRQKLYGKRRGIYRILFEIRGETVHVLHVRHGARRDIER
jgi:plasmid stabilization system protein ParE